jgi:hypothetical protein
MRTKTITATSSLVKGTIKGGSFLSVALVRFANLHPLTNTIPESY